MVVAISNITASIQSKTQKEKRVLRNGVICWQTHHRISSPLSPLSIEIWTAVPLGAPTLNPLTQEWIMNEWMNEWGGDLASTCVSYPLKNPLLIWGPIHDAHISIGTIGYSVFCLFHSFVLLWLPQEFPPPKETPLPFSSPPLPPLGHKFTSSQV